MDFTKEQIDQFIIINKLGANYQDYSYFYDDTENLSIKRKLLI